MPKIIPLHKPAPEPKEHLCLGHDCANFLYKLRDDGRIICDKCKAEIGWWTLDK